MIRSRNMSQLVAIFAGVCRKYYVCWSNVLACRQWFKINLSKDARESHSVQDSPYLIDCVHAYSDTFWHQGLVRQLASPSNQPRQSQMLHGPYFLAEQPVLPQFPSVRFFEQCIKGHILLVAMQVVAWILCRLVNDNLLSDVSCMSIAECDSFIQLIVVCILPSHSRCHQD
jgi:hypothetical protein